MTDWGSCVTHFKGCDCWEKRMEKLGELLTDVVNEGYAQHTPGCSAGMAGYEDWTPQQKIFYPCSCGYNEWLVEAKEALEVEE